MTSRRSVLAALFAAAVPKPSWASVGSPTYLAAAKEPDGSFAFFGLDDAGDDLFRVALPARAHAGCGHPTRPEAVLFARRPGAYALVIDCLTGATRAALTPPDGRQLNGHGVFLEGGAVLATSEQHSDTSDGVLGLWAADDGYRRLGEIPTGGIGPHDLRLMPDGRTMVVANGGIATDPEDRTKLNIPTMRPNLAFLRLDGPVERVELAPELRQNSIRHIALGPEGQVAFAMQWEGEEGRPVPLLGLHVSGQTTLASAPEAEVLTMKGYAGSIAFDGPGGRVAITSPKGGRMQAYDLNGTFLQAWERADICGLARWSDGFLASDGGGGLLGFAGDTPRPLALRRRAWDNHIVAL
jgi:hypothetical protein